MSIKKFPLLKFLAPLTLGLGGAILSPSYSAIAAPSLTITPITWNVIGLDSNKPTVDGPDRFMAGARVCNVGDATATNITAKFVKDGGSSYINIVGASSLSIPSLTAGSTSHPPGNTGPTPSNCYDFYFNLLVTRNSLAYSTLSNSTTRQQFHIEATATGLATVSTPAGRELYVEKLVSQARNQVYTITGPSTVYQGQTVQYTVTGATAPGGYEQLSVLPLLPGFFQLVSASTTYSTPAGSTNNTVHADACGWENDPSSTYYHNNLTCNNPAILDTYSGDKAGDNLTTVYTIKVLSTGSGALTNIIYDFSGSSYHYNADVGTGANNFAVTALPPQADLSITKTDNQTTANPGKPISYTITVKNNGPSDVTGATVTDTVPNTITGVSWACTASSGSSCGTASGTGNTINTTANLLSGGTATYTVTGTVSPTATGNLSNTASVAVPTGVTDPNTANNSSTDTDTIAPTPDLTITKSHTGNFNQSATGTYTITATNSGTAATSGLVTVTDTLPTGLTFGTASGTGWTCTVSGQTVTCTRTDALAAGTSYPAISLGVNVAANAPSSVINTASVSGGSEINTTNNSGSDPTTIASATVDLSITKTDGKTNINPGSPTTYTITVTNRGPSTVNSVTVTDNVPSSIQNPVFTPSTGTYNSSTGAWTGLNLASGQSVTLTLTGTVSSTATGTLTNTATVAAPTGVTESDSGNNSATDTTTIDPAADLSITKTDGQASATPGSSITYTITVTNNGPNSVTGAKVTDTVPNTITGVSWTCAASSNSSCGTASGTGNTINTTANLISGGTATYTVKGTVSPTASGNLTNTATVDPPAGIVDPSTANNSSTDTDTIAPAADLSLTKTASSTNPSVGQNITFTVTVTNSGPSAATGVTVTDLLPSGLTFVSATPSQGTYNNSTGVWTVGNIANGANATLQVVATLTSNNAVTNTAETTASGQPDPDSTPNNRVATEDDQASVTVGSAISKLLMVKRITAIFPANGTNTTSFVDDPGTTDDNASNWPAGYLKGATNGGAVQPGGEVEYTIYFLSNGGRTAQKVNMCDLIPANTIFNADAFGSSSGITRATGSAAPVNLTNTGTDNDGGQYVTAKGSLPQGVTCNASNTNGATIFNLGDIPNATAQGSPSNSYGFVRFRVKVK